MTGGSGGGGGAGAAPNPAQRRAAEPGASSWVSANAGSGKTRVLTDRVARLLLAGSEPARILCLTYTKAAAAEMQTRLFARLGAWAMLDDAALRCELAGLGEPETALAPERLARARTLFARALETPGGLKIQTIHAFCDALLRRFPLEAGVPPGFAVLEDRQATALRARALEAVATRQPDRLEALALHLSGDDPDPLLAEIAARRDRLAGPLDEARLARALGHRPGTDAAALAAGLLDADGRALLAAVLPAFAAGSATDRKAGARLAEALAAPPARALALLEDVFLTGAKAKEPFSAKVEKCPTKATRDAIGPLAPALDALMHRVEAARPRRLAAAAFARSLALHRFAAPYLAELDRLKSVGLLDFDDLVARTTRLLADPATAAFVLWRLDGGLDHVLVDEAQDTAPLQWRVIQAITDEFFAGEGARRLAGGAQRTIFVVGDEKQSIYSFQGADPRAFAEMRGHFEARLEAMDSALEACALLQSYRSARPILDLVDTVFAGPAGRHLAEPPRHEPSDPDRPGRVELWPFLPKPEKVEEPPWDAPLDMPAPDDPVLRLADRLAAEIRRWLDEGRVVPSRDGPRPIRPGDVLVLVQRRSSVFHPLIRALKRHRVPVAGADVLRIGGELAVKDLLAALRVAATPPDDLALAALLRSPLVGLSEAELFRLAHGRPASLIGALDAAPHAEARAFVQDLRDQADYLRPHELLERILIEHGGRRRLVARLGAEAEDGIDALLEQALDHERAEPPTLTGFLAWVGRGETVVKRRTDEAAGEVRVTTVHGAKGLQAPVVILPDTACRDEAGRRPELVPLGDTLAWSVSADECPAPLAEAEAERRERMAAENRRLLYVALTRPESWLIVCGAGREGRTEDECWHATVAAALGRLGAETDAEGRLVLEQGWPPAAPEAAAAAMPGTAGPARQVEPHRAAAEGAPSASPAALIARAARPPDDLPDWTRAPAPPAPEAARLLSPSALGGAHALPGEPPEADMLARGSRLHLLLEALPGRPASERAALAGRLLPDAPDLDDLLAEASTILDAPDLAPLFGPKARAEVTIAAPLAPGRVLGRIDRLLVEPARILAVDFKSNRTVPATAEAVPEAILRQMGAYAAALAAIYPDRAVECAIVWTRIARLMPLPASLTAAALARAAPAAPARP